MLLLMLFYTAFNFLALRGHSGGRSRRLTGKQLFFMELLLTLGYTVIYLHTEELTCIVLWACQTAFFLIYIHLNHRLYPDASDVILSNSSFLFCLGLMMIYRLEPGKALKQFLIGAAAYALTLVIPVMIRKMSILVRWAWLYAIVGLGLLLVVWKLGSTTYGAQLTLRLGPVGIQPSELVKISFVFFTASMFREKHHFKRVVLTTCVAAAHVLILAASTDLGSGLVYFLSYLCMLYTATHQAAWLGVGFGAGTGAAIAAYRFFDHVKVRVAMWKDPFSDYDNKGFQLAQSLFAISSGGWFGLGLCGGVPTTIPLAVNDFIFAAFCEETGMVFSCLILLIYLGFLLQLLRISINIEGDFYRIAGVGFAAMIGAQVLLHVGGASKLIPSTGITLPLLSYGGSSVLSTLIIIGIIQGLHLMEEDRRKEAEHGRK